MSKKSQHGASLSLLSRGVGDLKREITNLVHEKVDVHLEPQDYYNLHDYPTVADEALKDRLFEQEGAAVAHVPKTFTTRRGALLLFSEDMGATNRLRRHPKRLRNLRKSRNHQSVLGMVDFAIPEETIEVDSEEENEEGLRTVDDLTRSILSYGSREPDDIHLRFVHPRRPTKLVRPGFSARRYLSNLTNHFDPTFVDKMLASGRLSEKTLFQQSAFMPHVRRRIKDDLSLYPPPYRIMKQMLLATGPLNEFSFIWNRREKTEISLSTGDEDLELLEEGDIRLVERDKVAAGDKSREVSYSELDLSTQRSVLSNLLVKSAINHAIRKQEELEIRPLGRLDEHEGAGPPGMFDMITAVKSLLDTETEMDTVAPVHTGFRGRALRGRPTESGTSSSRITPLPITSRGVSQNVSRTTTPPGSISRRSHDVQLPPMSQLPLVSMPINEGLERQEVPVVNLTMEEEEEVKEAESEITETSHQTTGPAMATLGFMVPQFTPHLQPRVPSRMRKTPARLQPLSPRPEEKEEHVPGHMGKVTITFEGATVSSGPITVQHPQIEDLARSQDDLESDIVGKRAATGRTGISEKRYGYPMEIGRHDVTRRSSVASLGKKGVNIHAGDVDATLSFTKWSYQDQELDLEMEAILKPLDDEDDDIGAGGGPTPFTSEDLMTMLTGHADRVAESVLNTDTGGVDLAKDVKEAIRHIVTQRENASSREGVEGESDGGISQSEYKDMIKEALRAVVSQSAQGISIPDDMELSDEVLNRLTSSQGLLADELVITTDPVTGNSVLRIRRPSIVDGSRTHVVSRPNYGDGLETYLVDPALNFGAGPGTVVEESGPGSAMSSSVGSSVLGSSGAPGGRGQGRGISRRLFEAGKDKNSAVVRTVGAAPTTISEERSAMSADREPGPSEAREGLQAEERTSSQMPPTISESPTRQGEKSAMSRVSQPGIGERKKTMEKDKDEFVVGKVPDKEELQRLYGQLPEAQVKEGERSHLSTTSSTKPKKPPVPKASDAKKKKSKGKKKKSIAKAERKLSQKEDTLKSKTEDGSVTGDGSRREASELSGEYYLVDEEFSEDEDEVKTEDGTPVYPKRRYYPVPRVQDKGEPEEDEEEARLRKLSLREQREARRKADAEKRRAEMERRRLEREQKKRMESEEAEKMRLMEAEFEEERHRREEEFRSRKQKEREEREREEEARYQADLARQRHKEREARDREELIRRMEEMRKLHEEEEERKRIEEEERLKDEERRLLEEKEMLALMAEEERIEYERKKKEEEERRKKEEEELRKKREEEARLAMEEARRLAEEMARQKAAHDARQKFLKGLHLEYMGLQRTNRISRAYRWSYFDLLQWLGLELPEFEGKKGR